MRELSELASTPLFFFSPLWRVDSRLSIVVITNMLIFFTNHMTRRFGGCEGHPLAWYKSSFICTFLQSCPCVGRGPVVVYQYGSLVPIDRLMTNLRARLRLLSVVIGYVEGSSRQGKIAGGD